MKKIVSILGILIFSLVLAACSTSSKDSGKEKTEESKTQTVSYLGKEYELPKNVEKIITASLESVEDAAVLGVDPVGSVSAGGKDIYLAEKFKNTKLVGPRVPSSEKMLELDPDIIFGTTKWEESSFASFNKIATTIPYSSNANDWKVNLKFFGKIANKEDVADKAINDYEERVKALQAKIQASDIKNQKVILIRITGGLYVFPESAYLNPSLYQDFGLKKPKELDSLKPGPTKLSYETLAKWNPDIIFLQFSVDENPDTPDILDEILENKVFKSMDAVKNGKVFTNIIDPLAQGGTAWSKQLFIDAFEKNVLK